MKILKNKKRAKILLLIFSIVFSLILLEILSGILFKYLPKRLNNGKRQVELYLGITPTIQGSIKSHPYLLYQNNPNFYADGFKQNNSLSYRGKEFPLEKPDNTTRIIVLGGSTTNMYPFVKNPDDTWVAILEKTLQEKINKNIEVINAGLPYATSAELLSSYVFRHKYLKPDIIIIHTGGNDVAPLFFDDYNPEYTHFRSKGSGIIPRRFEKGLLSISNFMKLFYAVWLNSNQSVYQSQPYPFDLVDRANINEKVEKNQSEGFRRNIDTLITIAQAEGVKVVLFGFLQAKEAFLAKNNEKEFKGLEKAMVIGVAKHYKIMQKLADQHNIEFIIPNQSLFDDSWFQDNCHLNERGEKVKAKIMSDFFIKSQNRYFNEKKIE